MFSGTGATAASGAPENADATLLILNICTQWCQGWELQKMVLGDENPGVFIG